MEITIRIYILSHFLFTRVILRIMDGSVLRGDKWRLCEGSRLPGLVLLFTALPWPLRLRAAPGEAGRAVLLAARQDEACA